MTEWNIMLREIQGFNQGWIKGIITNQTSDEDSKDQKANSKI